ISSFAQYYFGIKYQLLLNADQKSYVQLGVQIVTLLLNTVGTIFLIRQGVSIHIVKLFTSIIFIIRPLFLMMYVKRNYYINNNIKLTEEPIKQKWNGLAQHLAAVVLGNTDIVVLTLFSTLENVSIYTVYNLVVTGVKQIIIALTTGVSALFGNMIAKKEMSNLLRAFRRFEIMMHFCVTIIFTITAILIVPFVKVYTKGVNDVNYIVPTFGILITVAQAAYCLRLPYNILVLAAGHYKQTQNSAIIEMILNIVISLISVVKFGLVGVALGTLVAMTYRTIYLVFYLRKNIISRSVFHFVKYIILNAIVVLLSIVLCSSFNFDVTTYLEWIILAIKVGITVITVSLSVNMIIDYKNFINNIIKR
uniref:lipopolysaccharide biosynthesis protein n=1 Tax=uncultured Clostridium sp. TaxID=59620 RepID=UPI002597B800